MSKWYIGSEALGIQTDHPPVLDSWRKLTPQSLPQVDIVSPDALAHVLRMMKKDDAEVTEHPGLPEDLNRLSEKVLSQYGAVALSMFDLKSRVVGGETHWTTEPLGTVGGELNYLLDDQAAAPKELLAA